jgi:hypothetical protein
LRVRHRPGGRPALDEKWQIRTRFWARNIPFFLLAAAKQSPAAERSIGRDCFVAQGAPRNDSANLIEIRFSERGPAAHLYIWLQRPPPHVLRPHAPGGAFPQPAVLPLPYKSNKNNHKRRFSDGGLTGR